MPDETGCHWQADQIRARPIYCDSDVKCSVTRHHNVSTHGYSFDAPRVDTTS